MTAAPRRELTPEQQGLLQRVLASPQFARTEILRRILVYLCERPTDVDYPLKEHEIAVGALGRPASFDPKTDAIIRVSIASIRERLARYFESSGAPEPIRLTIPKGAYKAQFASTPVSTGAAALRPPPDFALRQFWEPYLHPGISNTLMFSELLFFRDDHGNYYRNIYVNNPHRDAEELRRLQPGSSFAEWKPSFHFVSAGEMQSVLALCQAFQEMSAPLEVRNSRFSSWNTLQHSNLIILGSSRTNSFLALLQGEDQLVVAADCIRNMHPRPGEPEVFRGQRSLDGDLERVSEYALVTRRPGPLGGGAVTLISANHGRAMQGAASFLTEEDKLARLFDTFGLSRHTGFPPHFQVLLQVDMVDFDEEIMNVEYVTHRAG